MKFAPVLPARFFRGSNSDQSQSIEKNDAPSNGVPLTHVCMYIAAISSSVENNTV